MAPGMSVARRPLPVSPVSFKPQPKNESARSSTPYRIYSKQKITTLPLKPTLHQAKPFGKPLIGYSGAIAGLTRRLLRFDKFPPGERDRNHLTDIAKRYGKPPEWRFYKNKPGQDLSA